MNGNSPAGMTPNGTPTPNSSAQAPRVVRKKADPFAPIKKPVARPLAAKAAQVPRGLNGLRALNAPSVVPQPTRKVDHLGRPINQIEKAYTPVPPQTEFSVKSTPANCNDYQIRTTKREIREGLRYHIAKFNSKKEIDPSDQKTFIRPVSLHRRDPRQPPAGKRGKEEDVLMGDEELDNKERERQEIARAAKEAQRAADNAQIAPTGNAVPAAKKIHSFRNEKTTQIHRTAQTAEEMRESDLRYEEALPWHLEDAENKQTWVGTYEAALSNANVVLYIDGDCFRMVPIEKWYKFTPKNQFKTMGLEEAEAAMNKKSRGSRWQQREEKTKMEQQEMEEGRRAMGGKLYAVKGERVMPKNEARDHDDLDMNEDDLFQDDDEMPTMEAANDEETKFTTEKIKREQLGANLFGEADENEVDAELAQERKEKERERKLKKKLEKTLKRREKNYSFASDSDQDPYAAESDSDTSDEEKQAEDDRRKDEEAKLKEKNKLMASNPAGASGASSKGSNTPVGRPKAEGSLKKHNHLKRAASPHISASENSGNESTRKKHKKKHHGSSQPSGSGTPRQNSMAPSSSAPAGDRPRKTSIVTLPMTGSKLSAIQSRSPNPHNSDTEMSDAGNAPNAPNGSKRGGIKLRIGAGSASPSGQNTPNGSRAGSPVMGAQSLPYTAADVRAALPAQGITINELLKRFGSRIKGGGKDAVERQKFINVVKANSIYDNRDKLLRPKPMADGDTNMSG